MKRLVFSITLVALLLQIFSKGIILLSFEVNRDFIAKNLCVQKAAEDNCCKGSCQLKKQLNDDESKERSFPFQNLKDTADALFFAETNTLLPHSISGTGTVLFAYSFPVLTFAKSIQYPPPQV